MSLVKSSESTAASSPSVSRIRVRIENGLATVTLARPPVNVIDGQMMDELVSTLDGCRSAKVLLLRGEGRCFSAGADVGEHLPGRVERMLRRFRDVALALSDVPIPTVAWLHGAAMGGGLELALMADLVYAAPGTSLGQPEIALGVMAPIAAAWLPAQIGVRRTNDLLLTGRGISAEEAKSWGLINDVCDEPALGKMLENLLEKSRPALVATKAAIARGRGGHFREALPETMATYLNELMAARDPEEGLRAFLEKRAPKFEDR
jgi:cyclohexa-1,5-dienecarbonyl-CoA hydratase